MKNADECFKDQLDFLLYQKLKRDEQESYERGLEKNFQLTEERREKEERKEEREKEEYDERIRWEKEELDEMCDKEFEEKRYEERREREEKKEERKKGCTTRREYIEDFLKRYAECFEYAANEKNKIKDRQFSLTKAEYYLTKAKYDRSSDLDSPENGKSLDQILRENRD